MSYGHIAKSARLSLMLAVVFSASAESAAAETNCDFLARMMGWEGTSLASIVEQGTFEISGAEEFNEFQCAAESMSASILCFVERDQGPLRSVNIEKAYWEIGKTIELCLTRAPDTHYLTGNPDDGAIACWDIEGESETSLESEAGDPVKKAICLSKGVDTVDVWFQR